jgi:DNA-binding transcriptional LysR family regulator
MRVDPRHLEILAAIVETGSLTNGAELLGRSQPSVSRTVAYLEARLGEPLFEPGRRPLQPTELCRGLARHGRRVREAVTATANVIEAHRKGRRGLVRVGGTPFFMDGVVSARIAEFQLKNPDIRIDQSYGYTEELIARLRDGVLDLAICPVNRLRVPDGLHFTHLLVGQNIIACRHDHPLRMQNTVPIEAVERYPWIAPPAGSPLYADLKQVLSVLGSRDFRISFTGGTLTSVLNMLSRSDSLTVLPRSVVEAQADAYGVAALPLDIQHPSRDLGILEMSDRPSRGAVQRLKQFIEASFAHMGAPMRGT